MVSSGVASIVWAVYCRKERIKSAKGGGLDLLVWGTGRSEGRGNCGWMFCRSEEFSNSHPHLGSRAWPFLLVSHTYFLCVWLRCGSIVWSYCGGASILLRHYSVVCRCCSRTILLRCYLIVHSFCGRVAILLSTDADLFVQFKLPGPQNYLG